VFYVSHWHLRSPLKGVNVGGLFVARARERPPTPTERGAVLKKIGRGKKYCCGFYLAGVLELEHRRAENKSGGGSTSAAVFPKTITAIALIFTRCQNATRWLHIILRYRSGRGGGGNPQSPKKATRVMGREEARLGWTRRFKYPAAIRYFFLKGWTKPTSRYR
jgi:hypothetical protein